MTPVLSISFLSCQDLQQGREAQQQPHDVYIPRDPAPGDGGHRGRADVREDNQETRPRTLDCIQILRRIRAKRQIPAGKQNVSSILIINSNVSGTSPQSPSEA